MGKNSKKKQPKQQERDTSDLLGPGSVSGKSLSQRLTTARGGKNLTDVSPYKTPVPGCDCSHQAPGKDTGSQNDEAERSEVDGYVRGRIATMVIVVPMAVFGICLAVVGIATLKGAPLDSTQEFLRFTVSQSASLATLVLVFYFGRRTR